MIDRIEDLPTGTLGFAFHGQIRGEDIDQVLVPAIDAGVAQCDHLKLLLCFGDDFEGYTLDAAWDDSNLGLRQWSGFERLAVVTDLAWLRQGVRGLALLLPYPVRLFNPAEADDARRWLSESLGTIHVDQQGEVITLKLIGRLDPEAYARIDDDIATLLSHQEELRLLLDLSDFDGWLGLAALGHHLSLVREFHRAPGRVAVVGDRRWQHLTQRLMARFMTADTRYFDSSVLAKGQEWLCQSEVKVA
ncbi:MAG: STAS/SEC14 domain-containing protein [Synechococcaceae bacterium WB8_1B_136]|nr:STAS/SEC14 domain-containing protein [Synechococcaceae bacterium WB8_1B_136]